MLQRVPLEFSIASGDESDGDEVVENIGYWDERCLNINALDMLHVRLTGAIPSLVFPYSKNDDNTIAIGPSRPADPELCCQKVSGVRDRLAAASSAPTRAGDSCADNLSVIQPKTEYDNTGLVSVNPDVMESDPLYLQHVAKSGFKGQVVSIVLDRDGHEILYLVQYEDGDVEHLTWQEVLDHIIA